VTFETSKFENFKKRPKPAVFDVQEEEKEGSQTGELAGLYAWETANANLHLSEIIFKVCAIGKPSLTRVQLYFFQSSTILVGL
jgi:hypothetical protein